MNAPLRVTVAKAVGAVGVRGEVRVVSFTADPAAMFGYGPLYDGERECRVLGKREIKGGAFAVRFEGITDRDAAQVFKCLLQVPRDRLPPPDEDEFYHADLIDLQVLVEGRPSGIVRAVQNHGAGDLIDILGEDGRMWSVPFTRIDVPEIDFTARTLTVSLAAAEALRPSVGLPTDTDDTLES